MNEPQLAVIAATGATGVAHAAWSTLIERYGFDGVAETTQRVLPAIFLNLQGDEHTLERERLKGAYRHAWVINERMAHAITPVLMALEQAGINYRLTKGAAVIALTGQPGRRTMADFDIVIDAGDAHQAADIIRRAGFRNSDITPCPHRMPAGETPGLNFNRGSHRIDLHLAGARRPTKLFLSMLDTAPLHVMLGGSRVAIADPRLLLLHAVSHGEAGFSATDRIQAQVDVHVLTGYVALRDLADLARRVGLWPQLLSFAESTGMPATLPAPGITVRIRAATGDFISRIRSLPLTATRVRSIHDRRLSRAALRSSRSGSIRHRLVYHAWLQAGRFGRLERLAIRVLGGFIPPPATPLPSRLTSRPFAVPCECIATSPDPLAMFDWRFAVCLPSRRSDVVMRLIDSSLDHVDVCVFTNGSYVTRILADHINARTVYLRQVPSNLEVSIRPMSGLCRECFDGLSEMTIDLEVVRAEH